MAYLILWIVIPEAISENERREMRGEALNFSNIEKSVREVLNEIRNKVDHLAGQVREKVRRKK